MRVYVLIVAALFLTAGCAQPNATKPTAAPVESAPPAPAPSPRSPSPAVAEKKPSPPVARAPEARRGQRAPDYRQAMQGPRVPQTAASMNALLTEIDPDGVIFVPGSAMGNGGAVTVQAVWHDLSKSLKMDVLAAISTVWEKRTGATLLVDLYDQLGVHVAGSTLMRGRFVD